MGTKTPIEEHSCDVLVIGSGGAGLRAAIEATHKNARVLVVGKSGFGKAHTTLAQGGINAALGNADSRDNWQVHAVDTLKEGGEISDYRMVETLCKNASDAINELEEFGTSFAKDENGKILQRTFGAHSYPRTCFVGDFTGKEILDALVRECKKLRIKQVSAIYVSGLLVKNNKALGAVGVNQKNGKITVFKAKAVVLATGGYSRLYLSNTSHEHESEGFGCFLALENGLELKDMEMVQFHPTGMVWPKKARGLLVTEAVRAEGGKLFNSKNERFMEKYDAQRMELSARDVVARANFLEIIKGNQTPHGGVWLDITHRPKEYIEQRLPTMLEQFKKFNNIDISRQRMEVAPTAHYSMGGVKVNPDCSTGIKGLFAAGEVTAGLHGGNRLGGNSLAEIVVFGKIAGKNAAGHAQKEKTQNVGQKEIENEIKKIEKLFLGKKFDPQKIIMELRETMWKHAGVIRDKKTLEEGLKKVMELQKKSLDMKVKKGFRQNKSLQAALDALSLCALAETVIKSALIRTESRAAHYRTDFPQKNDSEWKASIHCKKEGKKLSFYTKKTPAPPKEITGALKAHAEAKYVPLE